MPSHMPPPEDHSAEIFKHRRRPGELLKQQQDADDARARAREPAELNIKVQGLPPKTNYQADGGDHFGRINIDPGRTRMTDI